MKIFLAAAIGLAATFAAPANAQNYPNQIIKVIVPFPPGGVLDAITRSITERLRENSARPRSSKIAPAPTVRSVSKPALRRRPMATRSAPSPSNR